MKIGLLEDNPAICDLITTTLELAGHTVVSYTYGISLLEALFTVHDSTTISLMYDVLVVDLGLPGELSGVAVINQLYERIEPSTLPTVIVSGAAQQELDAVHKRHPTLAVLRKPFNIQSLLTVVTEQYYMTQKKSVY